MNRRQVPLRSHPDRPVTARRPHRAAEAPPQLVQNPADPGTERFEAPAATFGTWPQRRPTTTTLVPLVRSGPALRASPQGPAAHAAERRGIPAPRHEHEDPLAAAQCPRDRPPRRLHHHATTRRLARPIHHLDQRPDALGWLADFHPAGNGLDGRHRSCEDQARPLDGSPAPQDVAHVQRWSLRCLHGPAALFDHNPQRRAAEGPQRYLTRPHDQAPVAELRLQPHFGDLTGRQGRRRQQDARAQDAPQLLSQAVRFRQRRENDPHVAPCCDQGGSQAGGGPDPWPGTDQVDRAAVATRHEGLRQFRERGRMSHRHRRSRGKAPAREIGRRRLSQQRGHRGNVVHGGPSQRVQQPVGEHREIP